MILASIPSPSQGVWHLGPLPIRAYALGIILGVVVAIWLGERRWVARGGRAGTVSDVAVWAIPFGLVGARLYHVATNPELYFAAGQRPIEALYIWNGGLGIWGSVALGAVGAYIGCRRAGADFRSFADALAPGVLIAQGIGRWGNWFNQELFGRPTDLPWGLEIASANRPIGYQQFETFHPTFLYESVWNIAAALIILWLDRRFKIGYGRIFALYVAFYTAGRAWIENLRIDDAHVFGPFRLNVWTALILFALAVAYFIWSSRKSPGRLEVIQDAGDSTGVTDSSDEGAAADDGEDSPARDDETTPST